MARSSEIALDRFMTATRKGWHLSRHKASTLALIAGTPLLMAAAPYPDMSLAMSDLVVAAVASGCVIAASFASVGLIRARRRERETTERASSEIRELSQRLARAETLLQRENELLIVWDGVGPAREVTGSVSGAPSTQDQILRLETWIGAQDHSDLAAHIGALRARGEAFDVAVATSTGAMLEVDGRCAGSAAVVRFRDLSDQRTELARMAERHRGLVREAEVTNTLLAGLPHPAWLRNEAGVLIWCNAAYAKAVDAATPAAAISAGLELLDSADRLATEKSLQSTGRYAARRDATSAGQRRAYDIEISRTSQGSAGLAIDVTEAHVARRAVDAVTEGHRRTLDTLPTPVALFDQRRRLIYSNPAWADLWGFEQSFLDEQPDEGTLLDRLREARKLPEQADYQLWKSKQLASHASAEGYESLWHLPDQRAIRVHRQPNPLGGLTLVQEDVTEHFGLLRSSETSARMQRETLDALTDSVVVFGSDGRLKLSNPAFSALWRFTPSTLAEKPHIDLVVAACASLHADPVVWQGLRAAVFAVGEDRAPYKARISRRDGTVIDVATMPLPEGATLATFVDVTAQVNVERGLTDRNEALEVADRIKTDFVKHVSYELRSPLQNIIGFAQLLAEARVGPLNDKQAEYMSYIMSSSTALLAIITDILDLATVDAGAMELDLSRVDISDTVQGAVAGIRDRLIEHDVKLQIEVPANAGGLLADPRRLRQILFNLLSNAIGFSQAGKTVRIAVEREDGHVLFKVEDQGRGIPAERLARVFDRFETATTGTRHRGAGLGLSIVRSFAELHGGQVMIRSAEGRGTSVTVKIPDASAKTGGGKSVAA